jgi:hypothetical protein
MAFSFVARSGHQKCASETGHKVPATVVNHQTTFERLKRRLLLLGQSCTMRRRPARIIALYPIGLGSCLQSILRCFLPWPNGRIWHYNVNRTGTCVVVLLLSPAVNSSVWTLLAQHLAPDDLNRKTPASAGPETWGGSQPDESSVAGQRQNGILNQIGHDTL